MELKYLFNDNLLLFNNYPVTISYAKKFLDRLIFLLDLDTSLNDGDRALIRRRINNFYREVSRKYISYLKFTRNGQIYYYGLDSLEPEEIEQFNFRFKNELAVGFTIIEEKDILPNVENDVSDILDFLNEAKEKMPIRIEDWNRKVIFFDDDATREDIETIYDYLLYLGADKWGLRSESSSEEYIEECLKFLETYNHLYFKIAKNAEGGYWINYGWDMDDYHHVQFDNVFDYQDVLEYIDIRNRGEAYDIINKLNESKIFDKIPKVGDKILCHSNVVMEYDGEICFFKGKSYPVVGFIDDHIILINECGPGDHHFSVLPEEESFYGKWFTTVPDFIDDILDNWFL